jgi:hypothetical protein
LRELRFKRRTPSRASIDEMRLERDERGMAVPFAAALKLFACPTAMNKAMSPRRSMRRSYHRGPGDLLPRTGKQVPTFGV